MAFFLNVVCIYIPLSRIMEKLLAGITVIVVTTKRYGKN
jgi:hypothetical protein